MRNTKKKKEHDEDDCWNWKGNKLNHVSKGYLINDKEIIYICNNPDCCNPNHLKKEEVILNEEEI
jgi:hypothetical protein